jgi:hypothetical protein
LLDTFEDPCAQHRFMTNAISDGDDPTKKWFRGTNPCIVLRYFAIKEATDDELKAFLKTYQIQTLADLKKNAVPAEPLIKLGLFAQFFEAMLHACKHEEETAEGSLGGKVVYDEKSILDNAYYTYSEDGVAVTPLAVERPDFNFTLVLGPSGSGKTMFALRRLPSLIFEQGEKAIFRVQYRTYIIYTRMLNGNVSFPEAVVSYVQTTIKVKLSESSLTDVTNVNLGLHVILDEAGSEMYKPWLDSASKITDIVNAIRETMVYKFLKGVHVTLVGTGLELSTMSIDSKTEITKFKMQPWTMENFDKLVDVTDYPEKEKVKRAVRRLPILMSLVANARCAYILLRYAVPEPVFLETKNWMESSLNGIISKVAHYYSNSNGLQSLDYPKGKWPMIRSVFREIDKATSQPNVAYIPRFQDLKPSFRSVALSMVDIHADLQDGELALRNSTYSVSLSPALFIVFATLLNADKEASWDWQTFQSTVALGEWKRMIVQSQDTPSHDDKSIVQMSYPVPPDKARMPLKIPKVNQFMVVVNEPRSSYADVIAPFRLTRLRFLNAATDQNLNLQDELDEMGLTNSAKHTKQQALTSIFYQNWNSTERAPTKTMEVVKKQLLPDHQPARSVYFPCDKLVSKLVYESPAVDKCRISNGIATVGNRQVDCLIAFEASRPVTAVFVTNCKAFILQGKINRQVLKEAEKFKIDPNDVDWQGKLKSKTLPEDAVLGLRENVEIRFLFVTI